MKKFLILLLLSTCALFAEDTFNIIVTVNYLSLETTDIYDEIYTSWELDTIATDTTVAMSSSDAIVITNHSNCVIDLAFATSDADPVWAGSSYVPWVPSAAPGIINEYALDVCFAPPASYDESTCTWNNLGLTPMVMISDIGEGVSYYANLRLTTPPYTSDRVMHEILFTIEARVH